MDNANEKRNGLTEFFDKKFKKILQGWSASVIRVTAEQIAAQERAMYETERALAILRFFSPASVNPHVNSYISVLGRENIEVTTSIIFKNDLFLSYVQNSVDDSQRPWLLTDQFVAQLRKTIFFDTLSVLLRSKSLSKFQDAILDSVTLYSEATRAKEFSSKLIYILSALESIFLKNENEPIQQNLAERIAILVGRDLDEKKILSTILNPFMNCVLSFCIMLKLLRIT